MGLSEGERVALIHPEQQNLVNLQLACSYKSHYG